jgi:hypothetical protein
MNKVILTIFSLVFLVIVARAAPVTYAWPGREPLNLPKGDIVSCDSPSARSRCGDGTCSTSTGSGTCSSHGGVVGSVDNQPAAPAPAPPTPIPAPAAPAPVPAPLPTAALTQPAPMVPASGGVLADRSLLDGILSAGLSLVLVAVGVKRIFKN